jgi:hypothetical protein
VTDLLVRRMERLCVDLGVSTLAFIAVLGSLKASSSKPSHSLDLLLTFFAFPSPD